MGLVIQDGKLLIKPMLDGDGNPVLDGNGNPKNALATATRPSEACDCCDTPVAGKCCQYPYSNSGPQIASTAEEAIQLASQSASANSAAIPNSIWTVGTPTGVPWVEGEAWYDEARNQYECTGYWTLGEKGECRSSTEAGCLSGPFSYFTPNATCDGLYDCPDITPPITGACCYPDGDIPAHCHDGETQVECESAGGTWHEGKVCNEDGECPPVDPPARCCVYTGYQVGFGCGQTSDEAKEDAEEIARGYPGSFIGEPVADPGNEDCAYICLVYVWDLNGGTIDCYDEDKNGNPVTQEFCDSLKTEKVKAADFTEGEDCGEASIGGRGTCDETPPSENRSNPLP